jgi:two-component system response regulator HydG
MQLDGCTVGLIEDDPLMGESLVQSLSLEGCHVDWWQTGDAAMRALRMTNPDLVICDIRLPDISGDNLFRTLASQGSVPPFLFVTAFGDVDQAVQVMRAGGGDYITKPFEMQAFVARARSLISRHSVSSTANALGVSHLMVELEASLRKICDLTSPLLVTGETGAGKDVVARFLHAISVRSKEPFIAVNCAAIPGELVERELFGFHGEGAQKFHRGLAERAKGGILFLDEIAELPLSLQAKLLRLIETREFSRVGGEQVMQFHGRIVCSTNRDVAALAESGEFRRDFYYRISGMRLEVPPLRERRDDIQWLMDKFFEQFGPIASSVLRGFSSLTYDQAMEYSWPGNVRELRNRVERACALTTGEWVMPYDLFPDASRSSAAKAASFVTLSQARDDAERRQIERALSKTSGQINEAAKLLGVSRTTLWERMRKFGIHSEHGADSTKF